LQDIAIKLQATYRMRLLFFPSLRVVVIVVVVAAEEVGLDARWSVLENGEYFVMKLLANC
jgi:hypothetical protein